MNLKVATNVAIAGASTGVLLSILDLLSRAFPALVWVLIARIGVVREVLFTCVSVAYLVFFIAFRSKLK
jgi:hypothetical protein